MPPVCPFLYIGPLSSLCQLLLYNTTSPELQSEDAWKLWLEGQLFETGEKLRVTQFDEMQRFIAEQLAPIKQMEEVDFNA